MKRFALASATLMFWTSAALALPSPDLDAADLIRAERQVLLISEVEVTSELITLLDRANAPNS